MKIMDYAIVSIEKAESVGITPDVYRKNGERMIVTCAEIRSNQKMEGDLAARLAALDGIKYSESELLFALELNQWKI